MRDTNAMQSVVCYGGEGTKPEPKAPKPAAEPAEPKHDDPKPVAPGNNQPAGGA